MRAFWMFAIGHHPGAAGSFSLRPDKENSILLHSKIDAREKLKSSYDRFLSEYEPGKKE